MSTHIGADAGQIAPTVLLPGDPLRARWIAETFLEDAVCYSEVRGMLGFTGTWQGQPVSVQGSGMGQPSMAIYVNELFREYDAQAIVRVGSCGALTEKLAVRDVVLASGACTDSAMNRYRFHDVDYAPVADFGLLRAAHDAAAARDDVTAHVGLIYSSDTFYSPRPELTKPLVDHGVLAVEMEASGLYTLAASYGRKALAICTVSDHMVTGEETTALERQETFGAMVEIALAAALGQGAGDLVTS
jgi:purine-nucleoside phosphorylase